MLLHDYYMVQISPKWISFEDGTIISIVCRKACSVKNNNWFALDLLFSFEAIMQKGCKCTECFDKNCFISYP